MSDEASLIRQLSAPDLKALIGACAAPEYPAEIGLVISSREDVFNQSLTRSMIDYDEGSRIY